MYEIDFMYLTYENIGVYFSMKTEFSIFHLGNNRCICHMKIEFSIFYV